MEAVLWFAGGVAIGLGILLPLLLLSGEEGPSGEPDRPSKPETKPPESVPDPAPRGEAGRRAPESRPEGASDADQEDGYRFYTILPDREAEVPEPSPDDPGPPDPEPPTPAEPPSSGQSAPPEAPPSDPEPPRPTEDGEYLLQVSAFRDPEAAEKLKARLAMQGLKARVVRADLADKGVWHRVRLGPYPQRSDAREIVDRLEGKGMEAIILRK